MTKEEIIEMAVKAGNSYLFDAIQTDFLERFAALVAEKEREAIMDEWWMCVQSDLENGVKSLNERAAKKWHKEYPAIAGFSGFIEAKKP